jgi:hypothetical protein
MRCGTVVEEQNHGYIAHRCDRFRDFGLASRSVPEREEKNAMDPNAVVVGIVVGGILLSLGSYAQLTAQPKSPTIDKESAGKADLNHKQNPKQR